MAYKTKKQNQKMRKSRKNKKRNIIGGSNSIVKFSTYLESIKPIDCQNNANNIMNKHIENIKELITNIKNEFPDNYNMLFSNVVLQMLLNKNNICIKHNKYRKLIIDIIDSIPIGLISIFYILDVSFIGYNSKNDPLRKEKKEIFEKIITNFDRSEITETELFEIYKKAISNYNADIIWVMYMNKYKLNPDKIEILQNFNERNNTEHRREQYNEIARILNIMKNDPKSDVSIISYAAAERGYQLDPETMEELMEYSYY